MVGSVLGPTQVEGQETPLERWTIGYVADSWAPRWAAFSGADTSRAVDRSRLRFVTTAEILSLRSALHQEESTTVLSARAPLTRSLGLQVSAASDSWRTDTDGRPLMETPRSEAFALGLDIGAEPPWGGYTQVEVRGGWDQAPGGHLRILNLGTRSTVALTGWYTQARESRVHFPADSLRTLGSEHRVWGADLDVTLRFHVEEVAVSPAFSWRREVFEPGDGEVDAFLSASPDGSSTGARGSIAVATDAWGGDVAYRYRDLDAPSRILRGDASAGQLPVASLELRGWSAGAWHRRRGRVWSLSVASAILTGGLSTRVETWPFVSIWQALSAQAYRLNGDLDGREVWIGLRNSPSVGPGWSWGVDVGRLVMRIDRDSWYVTSFGFGRSDRQMTTTGADPAVFVGGEGARSLRTRAGEFDLRVEAGVPVYVEELGGGGGAAEGGLAGYLRVAMGWSW